MVSRSPAGALQTSPGPLLKHCSIENQALTNTSEMRVTPLAIALTAGVEGSDAPLWLKKKEFRGVHWDRTYFIGTKLHQNYILSLSLPPSVALGDLGHITTCCPAGSVFSNTLRKNNLFALKIQVELLPLSTVDLPPWRRTPLTLLSKTATLSTITWE